MQGPNEDTEWNDVLRAKGILPPKEKKDITEDDIVSMLEQTIQQKTGGTGNYTIHFMPSSVPDPRLLITDRDRDPDPKF